MQLAPTQNLPNVTECVEISLHKRIISTKHKHSTGSTSTVSLQPAHSTLAHPGSIWWFGKVRNINTPAHSCSEKSKSISCPENKNDISLACIPTTEPLFHILEATILESSRWRFRGTFTELSAREMVNLASSLLHSCKIKYISKLNNRKGKNRKLSSYFSQTNLIRMKEEGPRVSLIKDDFRILGP